MFSQFDLDAYLGICSISLIFDPNGTINAICNAYSTKRGRAIVCKMLVNKLKRSSRRKE